MIRALVLTLLSGIFCAGAYSQNSAGFVPLKKAREADERISISSEKELSRLEKKPWEYQGVTAVRISAPLDIHRISRCLGAMEDLQEVWLENFSGNFESSDAEALKNIEELTVHVRSSNTALLSRFNAPGKLRSLTWWLDEVPDNYSFLASAAQCRKTGIIAPFVGKDLPNVLNALPNRDILEELWISCDRIREIPASVATFPVLKTLVIVDNLSWMSNGGWEDLTRSGTGLIGENDRRVDAWYLSDGLEFYADEKQHLAKRFGNAEQVPAKVVEAISPDREFAMKLPGLSFEYKTYQKPYEPKWNDQRNELSIIPDLNTRTYTVPLENGLDHVIYAGERMRLILPATQIRRSAALCPDEQLSLSIRTMQNAAELTGAVPALRYGGEAGDSRIFSHDQSMVVRLACTLPAQQEEKLPFLQMAVEMITRPDSSLLAWHWHDNRWVSNGRFIAFNAPADNPQLDIAPRDIMAILENPATRRIVPMDITPAEERFGNVNYRYLLPANETRMELQKYHGFYSAVSGLPNAPEKPGALLLKPGKALLSVKKVYTDKKLEPNTIRIAITDKTGGKAFPELKAFKGYSFALEDTTDARRFARTLLYKKRFSDVRISGSERDLKVELKTDEGYLNLKICENCDSDPKKTPAQKQRELKKRIARYNSILKAKNAAFNQFIRQAKDARVKELESAYAGTGKPFERQNMYIIDQGAYSCASVIDVYDSFSFVPKYITREGLPIDVKQTWVIYASSGTAIPFDASTIAYDPGKFSHIACTDFEGNLFLLDRETLLNLKPQNGGLLYMPMQPLPAGLRNAKAWMDYLGIKEKKR